MLFIQALFLIGSVYLGYGHYFLVDITSFVIVIISLLPFFCETDAFSFKCSRDYYIFIVFVSQ